MQKIIYALWRDPRLESTEFCRRLREEVAPQLLAQGVHGLTLNLVDEAVQGGNSPFIAATSPQMEAFVMLWIDSANQAWRQPHEDIIAAMGGRIAAWVVNESRPMRNERFVVAEGKRTPGFVQIALFQRPQRVHREHWLQIWLESHTRVAIDTQDTFLYAQNVVERGLHFDAPAYSAIVEEGFLQAALTDPLAFYGAGSDREEYRRRQAEMSASCARFIDGDKLDVMPTSQYVIKALGC